MDTCKEVANVTKLQRIGNLILSILLIIGGVYMLMDPQQALAILAIVMSAALLLYGVGKLLYYIRMARHMTGGLTVLFIAIIALDVAAFAISAIKGPKFALALYLICYYAITGVLSIARGVESKLFGSSWIPSILQALVCLSVASLCVTFINSDEIIIWVFCLSLFYTAGVRLVSVFKPTEIIYIQ